MRGYNAPPWPPGYGWRRGPGGVPPSEMRVSDAERREIADQLSRHFADGRLDRVEFDERMGKAMAAKTGSDLAGLLIDLPPLADATPKKAVSPPRRSRRAVFALALVLFLTTTTSWAWHSWQWRSWVWVPHLPLLIIAVVAFMLVRRGGWHHRGFDHGAARSR